MASIPPGTRLNSPSPSPSALATMRVCTKSGPILGRITSVDNGKCSQHYTSFLGVPFAAPTRPLCPPEVRAPWSIDLKCFEHGAAVLQKESTGLGKLLGCKVPHGSDLGNKMGPDCLNLNVLTPLTRTIDPAELTASLPVQIWIHGGSNGMCSNSGNFPGFSNTASSAFVSRGIVCVAINYRVGLHGFLHVPGTDISNLALQDMLMALEWVQLNIASFGGDPSNVTLMGQSAGAVAILNLLGSPRAAGLFQRAIAQSGGTNVMTRKFYEESVLPDYMEQLRPMLTANGILPDDTSAEAFRTLTEAQLKEASDVLEKAKPLAKKRGCLLSPPIFNSIVDELMFQNRHPLEHVRAGNAKDVDLLIGATYSEGSLFWALLPKTPVLHGISAWIFAKVLSSLVLPPAIRGFQGMTNADDSAVPTGAFKQASVDLIKGFGKIARERLEESGGNASTHWAGTGETDGAMQALGYLFGCGGIGATGVIQAQAKWRMPFVYELKLSDEESPRIRNGHMVDLPLLFTMDNDAEKRYVDGAFYGRPEGRGAGLDSLAESLQASWTQFCRTGNPGKFSNMEWPAFPAGVVLTTPRTGGPFPSPGPSVQRICKYAGSSKEFKLWTETMKQNGISLRNKGKMLAARQGRGLSTQHCLGLVVVAGAVALAAYQYKFTE